MSEVRESRETSQRRCQLCSKPSHRPFLKPAALSETNRDWVKKYTPELSQDALICEACTKCIQRHAGSDATPRWIPKEEKTEDLCTVIECTYPSRGATSIPYTVAKLHLHLPDEVNPLVLCNAHYQQLYRDVKSPPPCTACSSKPRAGERYIRKCPDPDMITEHLRNTTGFDGTLSTDSRVCKACYEFHLLIVKKKRENPKLDTIATMLLQKINAFRSTDQVTTDEYLDLAVSKTGLRLISILEKDEAVLLPVLHADFCDYLQVYSHLSSELCSNPPTTKWLLSALSIHFKDTLGMACKHRRYGTLLFRKGGDMLKALSKALGTVKMGMEKQVAVHSELKTIVKDINLCKPISDNDITKVCMSEPQPEDT